jgi:hypothetical protein
MHSSPKPLSKKDQILSLYKAGANSIGEIAALSHSRPSYVAEVLRKENIVGGYFDLYTSSEQPMNIHSSLFANRLGFRTENIARRSVQYIDRLYRQFAHTGDRAGQHHALVVALTMMNRAWWSKKPNEANIFRAWLLRQIADIDKEEPSLPVSKKQIKERVQQR